MPATLLLPNYLTPATDLKNPPSPSNQGRLLAGRLFNLSRHTVSFGSVVSLLAIFNFKGHGRSITSILRLTNQKSKCPYKRNFFDIP